MAPPRQQGGADLSGHIASVLLQAIDVSSILVTRLFMQFQRAQPSIVRSIRHVSLVKDWTRARRTAPLPHFSDFVPDDRAGDSADLMIAEARRIGEDIHFYCRSAGARVEQILNVSISDRYVRDSIDPKLLAAARPIWLACLDQGMPVFSVVPVNDRDGCPVTIEQIYLPYRLAGPHAELIVSAVHAWSTEGRFAIQGLLSNLATAPLHWAVIIDPALAVAPTDSADEIESN